MLSRKLPRAAKLRQIGQFNVYYNPGDSSITAIYHANYWYKIINAGINNVTYWFSTLALLFLPTQLHCVNS